MRGNRPHAALERMVAERVAAQPGETLLAAVSGGADSVALAALLRRCAAEAGARLVLGHVNHRTRSSSGQDEAVVLAVGAALHARVLVRLLPEGPANEARLREERYAALSEMAACVGARRIFTAHHAEDQTETVLLRLFRGAGPEALAGMPHKRPLGDSVLERPLLRVSRSALVAYCAARALPLVFDASNVDTTYRRNALRAALSELRKNFPRLDEAVARCAEIAEERSSRTERAWVRERLREEIALVDSLRDVTFERLDTVARAIEEGRRGRHFLKPGLRVKVD